MYCPCVYIRDKVTRIFDLINLEILLDTNERKSSRSYNVQLIFNSSSHFFIWEFKISYIFFSFVSYELQFILL